MVQKVNILLYLIDLCDVLLIQSNQSIHSPGQIFTGKRSHAVQLFYHFHYSCGRIEDNLIAYVFQLIAFTVVHLLVLAWYAEAGQPDNCIGEGEQDNHLENFDNSMRICHKPSLV